MRELPQPGTQQWPSGTELVCSLLFEKQVKSFDVPARGLELLQFRSSVALIPVKTCLWEGEHLPHGSSSRSPSSAGSAFGALGLSLPSCSPFCLTGPTSQLRPTWWPRDWSGAESFLLQERESKTESEWGRLSHRGSWEPPHWPSSSSSAASLRFSFWP